MILTLINWYKFISSTNNKRTHWYKQNKSQKWKCKIWGFEGTKGTFLRDERDIGDCTKPNPNPNPIH